MSLEEESTDVRGARRPAVVLAAPVIALALTIAALPGAGESRASLQAQVPEEGRPNVLVVMTDDQTVAQMRALPRVRARIAKRGTRFVNSFVNYPLCCPSRATFLTGRHARNHGVMDNQLPRGGVTRFDPNETLGVWLQRAGWYTGHVGKYLNGYGVASEATVPPGWSEWFAPSGETIDDVYSYEMNEDGATVQYGDGPEDFKQDVITRRALDFIARRAPARQPFFLYVGYTAPHFAGPEPSPQPPAYCEGETIPKPAPRHAGDFSSEPLPKPPSFDEADVSDKPFDVVSLPPLSAEDVTEIERGWRCALEELLSVDEGVGLLLDALRDAGELRNTLVVFTSDNGFFHGEHRIQAGKKRLYEESARVPLAIRGPGFRRGALVHELVTNADLAPTILEAAGAPAGLPVDGRPLQPLSRRPGLLHGRDLLIQSNRYEAVRTWRFIYAEHLDGSREMYDMAADPFQLESVHAAPAYGRERIALAGRLERLRRCAGERCTRPPSLRLRLAGRDGERSGRCLAAPVSAELRHADEPVETVAFRVGSESAGVDNRAPFRRLLRAGLFSGRRTSPVQATVDFVDGRRAILNRRATICRS